ncbi:MAG: hypothetical protein B6241_04775 [Spirochaetaceae bacterium 4572_59]|nr:MAG: hypothetical protein B6241_04775 [Spirochaetaceae bacterium 4572_59]
MPTGIILFPSAYSFPRAKISQAFDQLGNPGFLYDRILVSAAAPSFSEELTLQKEGDYSFSFVPLLY